MTPPIKYIPKCKPPNLKISTNNPETPHSLKENGIFLTVQDQDLIQFMHTSEKCFLDRCHKYHLTLKDAVFGKRGKVAKFALSNFIILYGPVPSHRT